MVKFVEKVTTHFMYSNFFKKKLCYLRDNVKNIVEVDMPQMAIWCTHIACWKPNAKNTLRICNAHFFSTATMVAQMRLSVRLYVHCLSYYFQLYNWKCPQCNGNLLKILSRWQWRYTVCNCALCSNEFRCILMLMCNFSRSTFSVQTTLPASPPCWTSGTLYLWNLRGHLPNDRITSQKTKPSTFGRLKQQEIPRHLSDRDPWSWMNLGLRLSCFVW